ncbi:MAG: ParB/RepB/Spo0J family partition protein [Rhodobacteraceae bacterium]|nr:ParB/RepB/Spo0J family partition protein [Paracoccaceae bacterium]
MAKKPEKKALGRGLSALMADIELPSHGMKDPEIIGVQTVEITKIFTNPEQPRRTFDEEDLADLARSVAEKGIIQPLIVREHPNGGGYEIVAGERRWRAAQRAKIDRIPVIVRNFSDLEMLEIAIIENIQRADLNPVDEARGYRMLMQKFGHTQDKLSDALGKSRSYLANTMRLLNLPEPVLQMLSDGQLSVGHARAMITADDPVALAKKTVARGLSVRQVETRSKKSATSRKTKTSKYTKKDADTISLEADLTANLGMKVTINHTAGKENGILSIEYKDFGHLDKLCQMLSATRKADSK